MRILQITVASLGGIGRLTRDIDSVLIKEGFESRIAYGRGEIIDPRRDYMFGSKVEIYLHAFWGRLDDSVGFHSKHGTRELLTFMDEFKPDLVHLHNLHGYYINIEILFSYLKRHNIPTVWTLHDCWSFTGHCANFEFSNCYKWKTQCNNCPISNSYPKTYIDRSRRNYNKKNVCFNSIHNLTLITPSEWLRSYVKQSFLNKHNVVTINNGIDLNVFHVTGVYKERAKKIVLGLASSWSERKGLNDFIRLAQILPDNFQIVLVGISDKIAKILPLNIKTISHTESVNELVDVYNKAFIFVNPTYEDNFPTTNLEALACGTSVLTYQTGGSVESVTNETGYIVPQGDVLALAEKIKAHIKNEYTISACRNHSLLYDKNIAYNKYVELYKKILNHE